MKAFLLITLGLLLGLTLAPFLDGATAPAPTTFPSTSKKKVKPVKPSAIISPSIKEGLCSHAGVNEILMKLASGYIDEMRNHDLITLKKKGVIIKNGSKQTDISKGIFRLNEKQYAVNFCTAYSELIKDYTETDLSY
jgi:hypothetical protein